MLEGLLASSGALASLCRTWLGDFSDDFIDRLNGSSLKHHVGPALHNPTSSRIA